MMSRRSGGRVAGRPASLFATVLLASACGSSDRPAAAPPGRDSAGITIIADSAPRWAPGHGWVVGESALVDIAGVGAPQAALRLSDGRIVVADGRPIGLRYFSAAGRELYSVGGAGDGPSELRSLFHLDLGRADTIVAFDLSKGQGVLFDPNGAFAGAVPVSPNLTPAGSNGFLPKGIAPDGRYLLQRDESPFPFPGAAGTVRDDSTRIFWLGRTGTLADSSARLVAGELFGFEVQAGPGDRVVTPLARPLARQLHVAAGPARVWVGDGATWEVRALGAQGAVERIVRLPLQVTPLTPAVRDTFIARYRARVGAGTGNPLQQQFAAGIAGAPFPDHFPAYGDLIAGEDSTLWLLRVGSLEEGAATSWTVLDPDGRWLGDVTLPPAFRPTAVGRGWVLGIQRTATGAARVRLYPLVER